MQINANTKIASLIKAHPDALERIISLSPRFTKLRNPILRKVMAGRTSIAMAAALGGCAVEDFFTQLAPLGFSIDRETKFVMDQVPLQEIPNFLKNLEPARLVELDVRPVIESGKDPLTIIIEKVSDLKEQQVLKLINSFDPTPLKSLLGKKGFASFTETVSAELVNTWFYKNTAEALVLEKADPSAAIGWDEILQRFSGKLVTVDVRQLEMPLPMHTILEALETLPADKALFVYHKRIPVFLLPELQERKLSYRVNEISEKEVHLLIYKD
jgi:uncharacterized protein (DUF2249 family)